MSFMGQKKESDKKGNNFPQQPSGLYATQGPPTGYPSPPYVAPPAYSYPGTAIGPYGYVTQGPPPPQGPPTYYQTVGIPPQGFNPVYYPQGQLPYVTTPQGTIIYQGGYDAGARFDLAQPVIPPPPPGSAPNPAQLAMMQGQNVVVTQQKGSFLTGGSDGGYTFW